MIKIHTAQSMNTQSRFNLILKQPNPTTSSIQITNKCFGSMTLQIKKNPVHKIQVKKSQYEKHKQIWQWRQKTQFPIVKIRSWRISDEKQINQETFLQILMQLEGDLKSLQQFKKVPFILAIYVLKQSLIGFERLHHRFGNFNLSANMIKFNQTNNCKVWINQQCFSNNISTGNINSEKEFIMELCKILWSRTIKTKKSIEFFEKIQSCKYFFQAVGKIENFVKVNKIKIPSSFQNLQQGKSPLLKTSLNMEFHYQQKKQKNLVKSSKIPTFIKNNATKKKNSMQTYTPLPRKMTSITQTCILDRSLTNISRNLSSNSFLKNQSNKRKNIRNGQQLIDEDTFLQDMNIRLIEPSPQKGQKNYQNLNGHLSGRQYYNQQAPQSPYGRVSEFDSFQDNKSGFSFNKCTSKQYLSPFQNAQNMFLTVLKPKKNSGTYSSSCNQIKQSPKKFKKLQDMGGQNESVEDFEQKNNKQMNGLFLNMNTPKQRRYSGDFSNRSNTKQQTAYFDSDKNLAPQKKGTENLLNIPRLKANKLQNLLKSPSHQVISKRIDSDIQQEDNEERSFLRQTIMSKNGWTGLNLLHQKNDIKQSFVDSTQIPVMYTIKTSELPKLGKMGKDIKSSMISDCEFELQFGQQIERQKQIRNQLLDILS